MIIRWFKVLIKVVFIGLLLLSIFLGIGYFYARNHYYNIPILMYHHVSPPEEGNITNVTPERFKEQIQFIKSRNYKVIGPYEFLEYLTNEKEIPSKNLVLISFDDGYQDNYIYAFKVLKEYNLPAIIFVVVNKIGREDYLTIDEIKKMQKKDIIFGSHTLNETYLPALSSKELKKEIFDSKKKLERISDEPVHFFAYCIGGYTKEAQSILKDAGYLIAFTTNRGFDKDWKNDDLFAVRRIKVTNKDNWFKLWAKLSGIYHVFHDIKDPY